MSGVSLDTSGVVMIEFAPGCDELVTWNRLSPFGQGYGGAMARELYDRLISEGWTHEAASQAVAFRNWAPETLAAIRKDCALAVDLGAPNTVASGARHWAIQQANGVEPFPPKRVIHSEDGKVRFASAASPEGDAS